MAKKSSVLRLLELMSGAELRLVAEHRGVSRAGTRAELARRIATDCGRSLGELVRRDGAPFTRDEWNDLVVRLFLGARRRSFEEICEEIEHGLSGRTADVLSELSSGNATIGDLRRDDAVAEHFARILGTTARRLRNFLSEEHGNRAVASLAHALVQQFPPRMGGVTALDAPDVELPFDAAEADEMPDPSPAPAPSVPRRILRAFRHLSVCALLGGGLCCYGAIAVLTAASEPSSWLPFSRPGARASSTWIGTASQLTPTFPMGGTAGSTRGSWSMRRSRIPA